MMFHLKPNKPCFFELNNMREYNFVLGSYKNLIAFGDGGNSAGAGGGSSGGE